MSNTEHHQALLDQGLKVAYPISISSVYVLGISVPDWLIIFTLFYTILQIVSILETKIPQWRAKYGDKNKG